MSSAKEKKTGKRKSFFIILKISIDFSSYYFGSQLLVDFSWSGFTFVQVNWNMLKSFCHKFHLPSRDRRDYYNTKNVF